MQTILMIEDNQALAESVSDYLTMEGFSVSLEADGLCASERILNEKPDLVILDLMLPGKDGLSICRDVRSEYTGMILMFTAKESEIDNIVGLEVGADDYLIKPVNPRLLLAKVKSLLRRRSETGADVVVDKSGLKQFGRLVVDSGQRVVRYSGDVLSLTTMEFDLLDLFSNHPEEILARDFIAQQVLGRKHDGLDRSIDTGVSQIRKKLGDNAREAVVIKTVRGKGYVFVPAALTLTE